MRLLDRRIIFSVLTFVAVLGAPEVLLRIFWSPEAASTREVGTRRFVTWLSELSLGQNVADELYVRDPDLLWSLRPGATFESVIRHRIRAGEEQSVRITINEDGYRGPRASLRRDGETESRVLCLGDSNCFGYPLDDAHGLPAVLEATLGDATVINGGVPGYSVLQGEIWYEERFADHEIDWLVLSFLNNDAWRQPAADRDLLSRRTPAWIRGLADRVRIVQWARSVLARPASPESFVPRVALEEFDAAYRRLIVAARERQARVLILDFRAYPEYEDYSERLMRIAEQEGVVYFPVARRIELAAVDPVAFQAYAAEANRVRRRWTEPALRHKPHLRYYAEVDPEHLNEVGVAWLADEVAQIFADAGARP